jgi:hypothetical protein
MVVEVLMSYGIELLREALVKRDGCLGRLLVEKVKGLFVSVALLLLSWWLAVVLLLRRYY